MYEQPKSKKRIVRNCNDRRKGTDQPDVCTDDTVCSKKPEKYARVRSEGRARMRHTGLHMNQYLRAAGKDLESFRNRLKETHLPEELQSKAETFLVQTVHALDVTEKKQMYRRELIGMEEKVKETAEQIEELLKSMRELGV